MNYTAQLETFSSIGHSTEKTYRFFDIYMIYKPAQQLNTKVKKKLITKVPLLKINQNTV